jgi:hypothetical protein
MPYIFQLLSSTLVALSVLVIRKKHTPLAAKDWDQEENPCYWCGRSDDFHDPESKQLVMAKDPQIPKTNPDEIEALIERLEQHKLDRRDEELIKRLLRFVLVLVDLVERKNLSIKQLRKMIFGWRTEKRRPVGKGEKKAGSEAECEVHHINKLADIDRPGQKEKPSWVKRMIARRRKTLVVCRKCHEEIHRGDYSGRKLSV